MAARGAPDGERKSITALFVDIKSSTDLIQDLDPEEARTILDPALQLMMNAVHRYEGYVAQSMGDGIFALFGAPIAHEDHPQRALYAALLMQEESRKQAEQLRREKGINLQLRVGVNTGEVVLRSIRKDDLQTDYVPVGQSTNLASRMENLAAPGSILVSEQTHKLTEGYFEFKPLGPAHIKGFNEPISIYEVLGLGPLRTKLQVSARRGLARFVGRQNEIEHLKRALDQAKIGHGQIVGVMGEPGVGKSRLFHEFKLLLQHGCLVLETFSVSHGKAYPYLPLIDLLKNYFQLGLYDDERVRREKITGRVLTLDRKLEDILPYLFFLLGVAEPTSPLQQMDPQIRRKRILEAIKRLLIRESLDQPLMIIFEDLHWLDAETQAFLQLLSESLATARILLLVNYRPEYQHEWGNRTYYTQLRLDPLGREQAGEMLDALLGESGGATGRSPLRQFILEKTEGNPFFMEEIVQELREQGVLTVGAHGRAPLPADIHIPTTVQAVLASRIDRLPPEEKSLLQTLAVLGREFSASLLKKVADQPEAELYPLLSHLRESEFIYEQPAFPEVEYIFKHALTQEVAYNSLLVERRKTMHERAAQAIEEVYQQRLEDHYSELAHHYSRSGNTQKAVDYLQLAGQQAVQRFANVEAVSHVTAALELLATLPDRPERAQQELTLQLTLGVPLMAIKGYAAPEMGNALTRALELCRQMENTPQLFSALVGLRRFYSLRAENKTARELGEQLLSLAQTTQDSAFLLEAHIGLGVTLFQIGELSQGLEHLEQGIRLYDPQRHRSHAFRYGLEPGVLCLMYTAAPLWSLGYPERALKRIRETLSLAQDLSHPHSLACALGFAALLHQLRREWQPAREQAETAIALATEHGFPVWAAWGAIVRSWTLTEQGQKEEGIAEMRKGIAALRETGTEAMLPWWFVFLAEAYGKSGQPDEGLTLLAETVEIVQKTGGHCYEAELYRLKGELTLQQFKVQSSEFKVPSSQQLTPSTQAEVEAESCFLKAIAIAQKQQAKSLELRAMMSLTRLWRQQALEQGAGSAEQDSRTTRHEVRNKLDEAHRMLADVYNWFTEGFDTKDLQEAQGLLDELGH
jgi:class 3 adenylate cyclase/predicted ATPase